MQQAGLPNASVQIEVRYRDDYFFTGNFNIFMARKVIQVIWYSLM